MIRPWGHWWEGDTEMRHYSGRGTLRQEHWWEGDTETGTLVGGGH